MVADAHYGFVRVAVHARHFFLHNNTIEIKNSNVNVQLLNYNRWTKRHVLCCSTNISTGVLYRGNHKKRVHMLFARANILGSGECRNSHMLEKIGVVNIRFNVARLLEFGYTDAYRNYNFSRFPTFPIEDGQLEVAKSGKVETGVRKCTRD